MRTLIPVFLLISLLFLLVGCGGGSQGIASSNATGRATFTITWPKQTRLIPNASESIVVQISNGNTVLASQTLARPAAGGTATANFPLLPPGTLTARATAYPNTDGTGTAQAKASLPLIIHASQNTSFSLTMASTIDHLELSPAPTSVEVGNSVALNVVAKDISGQIVLLSAGKLTWGPANSSVASVDASGRVSGLSPGNVTITVTDQESGKFASALVTVSGAAYLINGVTYVTSSQNETLTAAFKPAEGGATASNYKGYVLLHVTGVGQSYANVYNDAFYLYTGPFTTPTNGHDGGFYQLAFGTSTLSDGDRANNAENFLVFPLPAYNDAHDYTFVLNTGLTTPGQLHFGVSDGGFSDNTGAYTIQVTQLVPGP